MSKHKNHNLEVDDEFLAQLDFLKSDYDNCPADDRAVEAGYLACIVN